MLVASIMCYIISVFIFSFSKDYLIGTIFPSRIGV